MSRTTGGDLLFGDVEKEAFRKLMRRLERFSGVEMHRLAAQKGCEILEGHIMRDRVHMLISIPLKYAVSGRG